MHDDDLYLLYLAGELEQADAERFQRHLSECDVCRDRLLVAKKAHEATGRILESAPEALVAAAIGRAGAGTVPAARRWPFWSGLLVGLAGLVVALFVWRYPGPQAIPGDIVLRGFAPMATRPSRDENGRLRLDAGKDWASLSDFRFQPVEFTTMTLD